MMGGYEFKKASRAGLGAMVGLFAGIIGKCGICVVMIIMFGVSVVLNSSSSAHAFMTHNDGLNSSLAVQSSLHDEPTRNS